MKLSQLKVFQILDHIQWMYIKYTLIIYCIKNKPLLIL